jgi:leucyl aminopeptidase
LSRTCGEDAEIPGGRCLFLTNTHCLRRAKMLALEFMKFDIVTRKSDLKKFSTFVFPVYSDVKKEKLSHSGLIARIFSVDPEKLKKEERFSGGRSEELVLRMSARDGLKRVVFIGIGKQREASTVLIRRRMQRAGYIVRARGYRDPVIFFPPLPPSGEKDGMEAALVGFSIGVTHSLRYKTAEKYKKVNVSKVSIFHPEGRNKPLGFAIKASSALVPAIAEVRDLVDSPPNMLGPEEMAEKVKRLAGGKKEVSIKLHFPKEGRDGGFPLVHWVGKGSARKPLVVEMSYSPRAKGRLPSVVLVGKGVTFDTGGLNIKSFHHMGNMKDDMAGAAVAAGTLIVAARLGLKLKITALLPLAENTPSSNAYRPSDVLTARNGKTIEVISTDAEGRLLLADALAYAVEKKPDYIIDIATLTGACIVALGPFMGGLFASDDLLGKMLEEAASSAGELVWRMPLVEEMMPMVRSEIADLRNTLSDPYGGAIGAALFLREFVGKLPWAHLDVAGPAFFDKRYEMGPKGATGFGVHTLVRFLEKVSG